jgi:hypothetical protein
LKSQPWLTNCSLLFSGNFTEHGGHEDASLPGVWGSQEIDLGMGSIVFDWGWLFLSSGVLSQVHLEESGVAWTRPHYTVIPCLHCSGFSLTKYSVNWVQLAPR